MIQIVLFPDGVLQLYANPVNKNEVQKGSRFFIADDELELIQVCEWIGNGYKSRKIIEQKSKNMEVVL